jgi:hypothetical protein
MTVYIVTVDVPFMVEVEAEDEETAEEIGDRLIKEGYDIADQALFASPSFVHMGSRYDDTEVDEMEWVDAMTGEVVE